MISKEESLVLYSDRNLQLDPIYLTSKHIKRDHT